MGYRVLASLLPAVLLVALAPCTASAQSIGPDSLVTLAERHVVNGELETAESMFKQALATRDDLPLAHVGLGRIALKQGEVEAALEHFEKAEKLARRKGYLQFGQGLIAAAQGDDDAAKSKFQDAFRRNRSFAPALVELGKIQSKNILERFAVRRTLTRAINADPLTPDGYLELGKVYENAGDLDAAIEKYEDQLRVNPDNGETLMRLGMALIDKGRYWHARQRLFQAIQLNTGNEAEISLAMAATYLGDRQFRQAHDAYAQAFRIMPEEEVALYNDISEVGNRFEVAYYQRVSGEQRAIFLEKFWLRRDPTPAAHENPRMLEHFRRVWYAQKHYSDGRKPWDDRGSVYIRYGEPEHRATSASPNFIVDPSVDEVRERYLTGIYGSNIPDILTHTSFPSYPLVDPRQYTNDATTSRFMETWMTDWELSKTVDDGTSSQYSQESTRFGATTGLASLTRWEEWTYTRVAEGLQLTFVDRIGTGDYRFATPPMTASLDMTSRLHEYAPAEQYDMAKSRMPDLYMYDRTAEPLNFYYYTAQFRAPDNRTQMDVYYGLPTSELQFQRSESGFTASIKSGIAVFDTLWNVMARAEIPTQLQSRERPTLQRGAIHVDRRSVLFDGGERVLLNVQAEDIASGRMQAYRENIEVARFDTDRLAMSDIVLAGMITPADSVSRTTWERHGLNIVPMASRSFRPGQPLYVYVELYNLTRGEDYGETEYEVEYAIRAGAAEGGSILGTVGRILGGSSQRVGVGQVVEGIRDTEYQHFQIDTSNLRAGEYTLIITVHDLKSDQTVTKQRRFRIGGG